MGQFNLIPVIDEGMGNSTYLLDVGDGRAFVLDPERDLRQVRAEAARHGLRIAWAVETHLHADFISGVREPAAAEGATVVAPEVGPRGFEATGLSDGDTVEQRVSTIGAERATNLLLQVDGEDAFVEALLGSLDTFPDYFLRLGAVNHAGPAVLGGTPPLEPLTVERVQELVEAGAQVVDVRPAADFAAGHVPGALSNTLRPVFATWLGWLADPDRPVVIVRSPDQNPEDIVWEAAKVGFDTLAGELAGGMEAWTRTAPAATTSLVDATQVASEADAAVLNIRQGPEFAGGHVPGADNVELGALAYRLAETPTGPMVVMCGHGERAMTGASILERAGRTGIRVLAGGPDDWSRAAGRHLQVSA
jgi:hydroxyacylglutathione hydrolase